MQIYDVILISTEINQHKQRIQCLNYKLTNNKQKLYVADYSMHKK